MWLWHANLHDSMAIRVSCRYLCTLVGIYHSVFVSRQLILTNLAGSINTDLLRNIPDFLRPLAVRSHPQVHLVINA